VSKQYHYSHVAITVGAAGQMSVISQQEAEWRLAGAGKAAGTFKAVTTSPNQQTLDRIKGVSGAATRPNTPAPTAASPNAAVLQKIRTTSGTSGSTPPSSATGRYSYQPSPQKPGVIERLVKWLFN